MKINPQTYYAKNIVKYKKAVKNISKKLRMLSIFRLVSFVLSVSSLFVLMKKDITLAVLISLSFLILFFILIKKYIALQKTKNIMANLLTINQQEIEALNNNYSFFGAGDVHMDHSHDYAYDVDLFGRGSLFQFLNRTFSLGGNSILASWLKNGKCTTDINETQEAVEELGEIPEFRQFYTATGMLNKEDENKLLQFYSWIKTPLNFRFLKLLNVVSYILPGITMISLVLVFFNIAPFSLLLFFFFINLAVIGGILKRTNRTHGLLQKQFSTLDSYASLLVMVENQSFASPLLKGLKNKISDKNTSASKQIKKLSKIISFFDYRLNMLIAIFINGLLLWDLQCLLKLENWKKSCASIVPEWINAISELDALHSLANLKFNNPQYCFPAIKNNKILEAEDLTHPQIQEKEAVKNNISVDAPGNFIIITGPNMAGKSTFLRTVAVNLILARTGSVVCASKFSCNNIPLITSMRTTDSLLKHESYFYAELKKLKHIIITLQSGKPTFIILDEILKGTNSKDKQQGSYAFLEQLINLNGTGLIATHDLTLGELEQKYPGNIKNKCFEIEIEGAEIFYDYKLRDGITKKMNATFLMEQMGITTSKLVN